MPVGFKNQVYNFCVLKAVAELLIVTLIRTICLWIESYNRAPFRMAKFAYNLLTMVVAFIQCLYIADNFEQNRYILRNYGIISYI